MQLLFDHDFVYYNIAKGISVFCTWDETWLILAVFADTHSINLIHSDISKVHLK